VRVALTGATGYTGARLLSALRARGDAVSVLARPASVTPALRASGATVVAGDLEDAPALVRLTEGAEAVLHVAAVYRTAGHPDSYYRDINVGGTERLLEAAAAAGVGRFVHTSTVGVHGHVQDPPADESAPFAPGDIYQRTKLEAELLALEFGRRRGLPVAVVRPAAIYGPGERRLLKLFRAIARGRYAVVGSGRPFYHPVFIDDLVAGFLLALEKPAAVGESFIIGGDRYVTQDELAAMLARATGGRVLPFHVPAWPFLAAAAACEAVCVPFGLEPPIHRRRVEFWVKSRAFSIEKARRLLGYAPAMELDQGLSVTAAAYRKAGWL
jgi:nucleoside-diphosphate-sugar epimerase